ncbi:leucine zipper putative tumor suppressor 2 isoform X1 [Anguilla rostrata]|uniref:leucine zipper putative tumor suppressor 2 isoform X1 n=1 Tax=Anguilla rostrata TaxID=7938 RepID=UPI0030D5D345
MNWDSELNSVLSAAESSVAKIRRQLATPGKYPKDMIPEREVSHMTDFKPPPPPRPLPSLALSPAPQWEDLAGIQAQLQSQNQAIESLTKALRSMESERQSQQLHLQALKEELRRLREREEAREQERVGGGASASPGAERRMENWKREVGRELSSLRGHIDRAVSLTHQEESFSSKMQREEIEQLRREVDQLKQQLRRQEEDMFRQQSETREARRQSERSCKTLESLTDCYRTHSLDLTRTMSQHQSTQEDIRQLRLSVSELKDEVRGLTLRDRRPAPVLTRPKAAASRSEERRGEASGSDSEGDWSPTPSLGEVSSDDPSWGAERDPGPQGKRQDFSSQLDESDDGEASLEEKGEEDSIDLEGDLEALSDSPAELNLSDL